MTKVTQKKTNRPLVLTAVILAMFMAAVEATIVATAMPSIVAELGGFALFSWVFSAYLLMQVVTIPIYGKLADLYGRKLIFTIGILLFLMGSILCGFSVSMEMLIIARFIQGIGAGAVQPIASTIVGDMYTKEERANIQGYLASVWGIASILGPVLGGVFVEYIGWTWVFWMNVPFGIVAIIGVVYFLHEELESGKKRSVDYLGSGLLFISISSLMIILIQGGVTWPWDSKPIVMFTVMFLLSFWLFYRQEKRCEEPVMPLKVWKHRLILIANSASFTSGALLLAVSSFLPTYVQGVMNQSPMIAGFTLSMISIGWPISSTIAGKVMLRLGFRTTALIGSVALLFGSLFYVTLPWMSHPVYAGIGSFFVGVGMGFTMTPFIVAIQSSVGWKDRGVATASNMFMRSLGGAVGVALLGGILNSRLSSYLNQLKGHENIPLDLDVANLLLEQAVRESLTNSEIEVIQNGLVYSLSFVFWGIVLFAVVSLILTWFIPKKERITKQDSL